MGGLNPKTVHMSVCHLGSGCSLTAVRDGRSVDTTMGMTPLEGLMMMTRVGKIDAGIIEYLEHRTGKDTHEITTILNKQSGIVGVSGKHDMRDVIQGAGLDDVNAVNSCDPYDPKFLDRET